MPPAAALECERTGWTLDMMATVAPSRAAARAARWPARPAPMMRTSWAGMAGDVITGRAGYVFIRAPAAGHDRRRQRGCAVPAPGDHRRRARRPGRRGGGGRRAGGTGV